MPLFCHLLRVFSHVHAELDRCGSAVMHGGKPGLDKNRRGKDVAFPELAGVVSRARNSVARIIVDVANPCAASLVVGILVEERDAFCLRGVRGNKIVKDHRRK